MAVAGPVLLTSMSSLGVTAVVLTVFPYTTLFRSSVALVAPAVLLTRLWSGVLASRWTRSVVHTAAPAARSETEWMMLWPMQQAVGGSPASKVSSTKVKAEGRTSVRSTLWASWGPWLGTATW